MEPIPSEIHKLLYVWLVGMCRPLVKCGRVDMRTVSG